jgi:hypothetical protein
VRHNDEGETMAAKRKKAKSRGTSNKPKFDQITETLARTAVDSLAKLADFGQMSMKFASSFTPQVEQLQRRIQRDGKLRSNVAKEMIGAAVELQKARRQQRERLAAVEGRLFGVGVELAKAMLAGAARKQSGAGAKRGIGKKKS